MSEPMTSWAHARGECQDHGGFIPQDRPKALYGELRQLLGEILPDLARQKEGRLLEGPLLPDPVQRCLEIPPTHALASGSGLLKGKSALASARPGQETDWNCVGEHGWAP